MVRSVTVPTRSDLAIARFMRTLCTAALELARELESIEVAGQPGRLDIERAGLGSLQLAVARALAATDAEVGASPREIASAMDRPDEPNVRTALNRLGDRGIAEQLPNRPTQRWRLTAPYRSA
jgi:hypothetical protein